MSGQPAGRRALPLLFALAACASHAAADDAYRLSVEPAWNGHVKPGIPSELGLTLLPATGGQARLSVRSSGAVVHGDANFEAGQPLRMHLPLVHDSAEPVAVELAIDGRVVHRHSQPLHVLSAATPVLAVVDPDGAGDWRPVPEAMPAAKVLYLEAAELPHTGQAYQLLSALFLAESALQAMTDNQRRALAEYAAGCGRLQLSAAASREARELLAAAGCAARNLVVAAAGQAGDSAPPGVSPRPAGATLQALLAQDRDPVLRSVLVFLAGYVLVLLLAARAARTAVTLLALPLAATGLAVLAWTLASPRIQLAGLAEMDSGDPLARYAGLVQVTGVAPAEIFLGLDAPLGLPSALQAGQSVEVRIDAAAQYSDLRLDTQLMSRHAFRVEGIARGADLALEHTASGVQVTNRGATHSPPAVLAWRGQRFALPALAAGQQWHPPQEADSWRSTAAEQLLRERAADGGSWLLLPWDVPALRLPADADEIAGWMLVRGTSGA